MRHLGLLNEFRELIAQFSREAEAASAMQQYDAHLVAEQVICGLMQSLCGWPQMRNLNAEQSNFPGIDLADDGARVAIQVTATADLTKVKHTLEKLISHGLHQRYDRLVVYVLTAKQGSYSQTAIDGVTGDSFTLTADQDIWDYRDLCAKATEASPVSLQQAVNHLKTYLRGVPMGLADEDIDPPLLPSESLTVNWLPLYFPHSLHIAQLSQEITTETKGGRPISGRKAIQSFCRTNQIAVPSAYVVHSGALVSFWDLDSTDSPYRHLIEPGTQEQLSSREFCEIDEDHQNVFKSLLRFSLQQRLYQEGVCWYHEEKQFVFLPRTGSQDLREEVWQGDKKSKRIVYERKYNKNDRSKVFTQKHLSFSVDFHHIADEWLMSITPSWFFSYGADFKKSGFGHDNLSWLKRQENNRAVLNHFRFISAWLKSIDEEDLFSSNGGKNLVLTFGDSIALEGAPLLDEALWAALPEHSTDEDGLISRRLFG